MRVLGLALIVMLLAGSSVAHADAAPTQVVLTYMPTVSTTGTPAASGIAELVLSEGEVRISATDLPRLDGSQQYVAWVVDTSTNAFLRLGAFNAAQSTGAVHFEQVLDDPIPTDQPWNLVLVTVEDSKTPDHPGPRHSIAGLFPAAGSDVVPQLLPNTGGADPDDLPPVPTSNWLPSAGLVALALVVGFGTGYVFGKR